MTDNIQGKKKVKTDNKIITVKISNYILKICNLNFSDLAKIVQIINVAFKILINDILCILVHVTVEV